MAKEFYTSGIGSAQTLNPSDESKIPIYDSVDDVEADLANLEENQIVATKDKAVGELLHTVDVVESGNMHPVTSNAVANKCSTFINKCCRFPDYAHRITITGTSWVATEDCYISLIQLLDSSATTQHLSIDGVQVTNRDAQGSLAILNFSGYVKKGQTVSYEYLSYSNFCKVYPLI